MESNSKQDRSLEFVAKSAIFLLVSVVVSKVFNYFHRIIIARSFGPEIYGLFSLSFMLTNLLLAFSLLGLNQGILRFVSFYRGGGQEKKALYTTEIILKIIFYLSIVISLVFFFSANLIAEAFFHEPELVYYLKLFAWVIPLTAITTYFSNLVRANEKIIAYSFITNILPSILKVLLLIGLIFIGIGSPSVPLSYLVATAVTLIMAFSIGKKYSFFGSGKSSLSKIEKERIRSRIWNYSLPLLFFSVINVLLLSSDSILIGYFKTSLEVGLYNAATPIAYILTITGALFLTPLFPLISRAYGGGNRGLINSTSQQISKWILFVNLPLFLLIILFPDTAIRILFGNEFLGASMALRILSFGTIFYATFEISNNIILMVGRTKTLLWDVIFVSLCNILLNILLIPLPSIIGIDNSLGITGAALATTISMMILNLLFFVQAKKFFGFSPFRKETLRVALSAIVPFLLLLLSLQFFSFSRWEEVFLSLLFMICYLFLAIIFSVFDKQDILIFKLVLARLHLSRGRVANVGQEIFE